MHSYSSYTFVMMKFGFQNALTKDNLEHFSLKNFQLNTLASYYMFLTNFLIGSRNFGRNSWPVFELHEAQRNQAQPANITTTSARQAITTAASAIPSCSGHYSKSCRSAAATLSTTTLSRTTHQRQCSVSHPFNTLSISTDDATLFNWPSTTTHCTVTCICSAM